MQKFLEHFEKDGGKDETAIVTDLKDVVSGVLLSTMSPTHCYTPLYRVVLMEIRSHN